MKNSIAIELNNIAVSALSTGDLHRGHSILSRTFSETTYKRHSVHNLSAKDGKPPARTLEFSLQDCSQNLVRYMNKSCSSVNCSESHRWLSLSFLSIEIPEGVEGKAYVEQLCSCSVSWAIGYNLSLVYTLLSFLKAPHAGGSLLLRKALRILIPIKRQMELQPSSSPFWTNLKLSILNNYIWILKERGSIDIGSSVMAMQEILTKSRSHMDLVDIKRFYLSLQFLKNSTSVAAAA